jgi:hypothetical protein
LQTTDFIEYPSIGTFSTVYVKQYQHTHPALAAQSNTSLAEAIAYNDTSVAMFHKVVRHFADEGKIVVIAGHSFGAFLLAEYLDDYGLEKVHKAIVMAGRLDMNEAVWKAFATGYWGYFEADGLGVEVPTEQADVDLHSYMKLMAGFGYNRQTDSLKGKDLSKVMYLYGEFDEAVGRLLPHEVSLLNSGGATVVKVPKGDHGSMFSQLYTTKVVAFIRGENVASLAKKLTSSDVLVYPTLVSDVLTIDLSISGTLTVTNNLGQQVLGTSLLAGRNELVLRHLKSGIYHTNFIAEDGRAARQKIIMQ